jgi:hypothetical protein
MKEIIKKVFSKKVVMPIFIVFGVIGVFNFIVFPGLTTADTALNVISALLAIFTWAFLFYYIDSFKLMEPPKIEPGETEIDYINPDELKAKTKKRKKREFPMEPHRETVKKNNLKQFDGVKSEEPFVKTRKKTTK